MQNALKSLLLLSVALLFWTASPSLAFAHSTDPTTEEGQVDTQTQATQWLEYLSGELSLDEQQKAAIQPTLLAAANSLQAIKTQPATKSEDDIINDMNKVIESVLKPEQKTKFSQMGQAWKARLKG